VLIVIETRFIVDIDAIVLTSVNVSVNLMASVAENRAGRGASFAPVEWRQARRAVPAIIYYNVISYCFV
jgi:hypothetical protein